VAAGRAEMPPIGRIDEHSHRMMDAKVENFMHPAAIRRAAEGYYKQDLGLRVTASLLGAEVKNIRKHDVGHFRSLEQHVECSS